MADLGELPKVDTTISKEPAFDYVAENRQVMNHVQEKYPEACLSVKDDKGREALVFTNSPEDFNLKGKYLALDDPLIFFSALTERGYFELISPDNEIFTLQDIDLTKMQDAFEVEGIKDRNPRNFPSRGVWAGFNMDIWKNPEFHHQTQHKIMQGNLGDSGLLKRVGEFLGRNQKTGEIMVKSESTKNSAPSVSTQDILSQL